ncbi:hypothetical protein ACN23B_22905 [Anabaena sp. FACHB-709]|uniref:Uncharacterized protein n=1 Tax=Anabaena cylindrica FACHB-318 TaxID=2692880 RepID=A0ABR7ZQC1_ANACY|nr:MULTISPECIES: hypothetical protein [Nostocaceae]MBD2174727.1 hypothetical protein [Anabaena cylindrica FACHB-318]MBD2266500.1 hypothetical protein [Anabaena sp. FACHB-709]MBD2276092.1 hypothetical protein [Nostoc sp. PCC 7120 = FACHB-418]MBD2286768.1 hypothetical protein [Anabaena cylindrica FACHB-170]MBD2352306.1 hypothetical protein [Trichormus variabilis FACHB-171]
MVNIPPPHRTIPLVENGNKFTCDQIACRHNAIPAQKLAVAMNLEYFV